MNRKHYLVLGIIVIAVVVVAILISRDASTEISVLTENSVVINKETSGVASSPMDLELSITQFSDDKTSEITTKVSKRENYPTGGVNWTGTAAKIILPAGLELIDGDLNWQGDIIGDDVKKFKIKVKAVKNGEWIIEANARYFIDEANWFGDAERFYVLVSDDGVLISDSSFTPVNTTEKTLMTEN